MEKLFKRKVVQDGAWYTLANIVTQLSSLVGVLFVSRYLGPTNLGIYSFVQNYIAAFVTVLAGVDIYANWYIVKSKDYYSELRHYIFQKSIITGGVLAILIVCAFVFLPKDILVFLPFLCLPLLANVCASCVFVLQYHNKAKLVALGMIVSPIILMAAKILAVITEQKLIVFVAINSLDGLLLIALATYYIFIIRGRKINKQEEKLQSFRQLIKNSVYGVIYIFFWYLVTRADQFVIPAYFNAYSLGVYSAAVKVIEMANVLIVVLQLLVLPRIIYILGEEGGTRKIHITIGVYMLAGVLAAGAIQILAPVVVGLLFGPAFIETASILRIYAWSMPGLFVSYLFSVVAMANSTIKPLAFHSVITALVMLGGLFYVSDTGNMLAVASISVIVYTLSAITLYVMWRKKYI